MEEEVLMVKHSCLKHSEDDLVVYLAQTQAVLTTTRADLEELL